MIWTAFGKPVEPEVSCINARSSSSVGTGSTGSAANSCSMVSTVMPRSSSTGTATMNGFGDDDRFRVDHADHVGGVFRPEHQVGAGCRLVKHGQDGAAHPQALRRRRDLDGSARQHADSVAVTHSCGGQAACHPAGPFVHFTPGVPDREVRFAGDHALGAAVRVGVHRVGEAAHGSPVSGALLQKLRRARSLHCVGCVGPAWAVSWDFAIRIAVLSQSLHHDSGRTAAQCWGVS